MWVAELLSHLGVPGPHAVKQDHEEIFKKFNSVQIKKSLICTQFYAISRDLASTLSWLRGHWPETLKTPALNSCLPNGPEAMSLISSLLTPLALNTGQRRPQQTL